MELLVGEEAGGLGECGYVQDAGGWREVLRD